MPPSPSVGPRPIVAAPRHLAVAYPDRWRWRRSNGKISLMVWPQAVARSGSASIWPGTIEIGPRMMMRVLLVSRWLQWKPLFYRGFFMPENIFVHLFVQFRPRLFPGKNAEFRQAVPASFRSVEFFGRIVAVGTGLAEPGRIALASPAGPPYKLRRLAGFPAVRFPPPTAPSELFCCAGLSDFWNGIQRAI
jgi:hypothetical protein